VGSCSFKLERRTTQGTGAGIESPDIVKNLLEGACIWPSGREAAFVYWSIGQFRPDGTGIASGKALDAKRQSEWNLNSLIKGGQIDDF
jgi:hypothetical protein